MRRTAVVVVGSLLALGSLSSLSSAQDFPPSPAGPPPPIAPSEPQPAPTEPAPQPPPPAQPAPGQPPAQPGQVPPGAQPPAAQPAPGQPAPAQPPPGQPAGAGFGVNAAASTESGIEFDAGGEFDDLPENAEFEFRRMSLREQNGLYASTGLFRVARAGSGAVGTFRFSMTTSYFTKSGFLCPPCLTPNGGRASFSDDVERVGADVQVSATPVEFLEAYFGIHSQATSNTLGQPELLQVLGDTNIGLKGFIPHRPDGILTAGGAAELILLNGTGGVGIKDASFALSALATLQLDNRVNVEERIPFRSHLNLKYIFDNSSNLVDSIEDQRGQPITRIERFGLDINRVDTFQIGLGAEGVWEVARPFLEWTVDIPSNRKDYSCQRNLSYVGDVCLADDTAFSGVPSRFTMGVRVFPWLEGLGLLAAFDVGTGATSLFWEEVAPEPSWNLHFGIGYAADTKPQVKVERVEVARAPVEQVSPPVELYIDGVVVDKATGEGVPDAIVYYDGRNITGMVTDAQGQFKTRNLDPGTYAFSVKADGFKDGTCTATVAAPTSSGTLIDPMAPTPAGTPDIHGQQGLGPSGATAPPDAAAAAPAPPPGSPVTPIRCELEALPKVGNINGSLRGPDGSPVGGAKVVITDKLGRSLELNADAQGAFRFENVPPGTIKLTISSPGFLDNVTEWDVEGGQDVDAKITMNPEPERPNVVVTQKEVKIKKKILFEHNSAKIEGESAAIIQEIASVLRDHPELQLIEIQGHTDDTGSPNYNLTLSNERANAVRDALIDLNVEASRLTARGFGSSAPLAPNVSEANRSRNRRVQFMILRRR